MATTKKDLKKEEKSKCLAHGQLSERCGKGKPISLVYRGKDATHNEVDDDITSVISLLMEETVKQTTLADKQFLNTVPTSSRKGRRFKGQLQ